MVLAKATRAACCAVLAGIALSGCATKEDLALLRQPALPPLYVAKAIPSRPLYHNVIVQQVTGAPEFRWFDGGSVLTTRPTRVQVIRAMKQKLENADMLASSALDADYLLNIDFQELHGPDVWVASTKLASARMTFTLVERRTGKIQRSLPVTAEYKARWIGITPEEVRAAIAGPIGVTKDSAIAPIGGAIGGVVLGYYLNGELVMQLADAPIAGLVGARQAELTGGDDAAPAGFAASLTAALAVGGARGHFTDLESALAGGFIVGVGAATGPVVYTRFDKEGQVSALNGTSRRLAATGGLMALAFDRFTDDLVGERLVAMKKAVSCRSLNPSGYRVAYTAQTEDSYALDCPDAKYNWRVEDRSPPSH